MCVIMQIQLFHQDGLRTRAEAPGPSALLCVCTGGAQVLQQRATLYRICISTDESQICCYTNHLSPVPSPVPSPVLSPVPSLVSSPVPSPVPSPEPAPVPHGRVCVWTQQACDRRSAEQQLGSSPTEICSRYWTEPSDVHC